eukprot:CAMPEP_0180505442 /NCGR_PEP_ID=MMETSP1036_2-20121128/47368_1 /TAXON_ID=632150 /ORGANISM="Azadinium spinosum, Strain 3D9" /LENGTH=46 /DNA_ID= /DNA_START= /DNA_END= /DNA_ORIENTATION=
MTRTLLFAQAIANARSSSCVMMREIALRYSGRFSETTAMSAPPFGS